MNVQARIPANSLFGDALPSDTPELGLVHDWAVPGSNNPPADEPVVPAAPAAPAKPQTDIINQARHNYLATAEFLQNTPVIETTEQAVIAANRIESTRKTIQDLEAERRGRVDPLNTEVKAINDDYRLPRESIDGLLKELSRRLKIFTDAEEARREAEAEHLRLVAIEAERVARAADDAAKQSLADSDEGVVADVAGAIVEAKQTFRTFAKATHVAAIAEKNTKVRFNGGFGRAVSMRTAETLLPDDAYAAIEEMGITEKIAEAILTSAREWRKTRGRLPAGVTSEKERKF